MDALHGATGSAHAGCSDQEPAPRARPVGAVGGLAWQSARPRGNAAMRERPFRWTRSRMSGPMVPRGATCRHDAGTSSVTQEIGPAPCPMIEILLMGISLSSETVG